MHPENDFPQERTMSGMPGRSGRRPKPLADHVLSGTYRPSRHGPLPTDPVLTAAVPAASIRAVSAAKRRRVLEGLGAAGQHFCLVLLREYGNWGAADLELLREAGHAVDRLATLRTAI